MPDDLHQQPHAVDHRSARVLARVCLCLALAWFLWRGPFRIGGTRLWDFAIYSSSSYAMLHGENPYDERRVARIWAHRGGVPGVTSDVEWLQAILPPSGLLALLPFAALPPLWGCMLWLTAGSILLILQTIVLVRLGGPPLSGARALWLIALVLVLAPVQNGLLAGQPAVVAIALIIVGAYLTESGREGAGGILLGLATAMKMQLAAPFLVFWLARGRWRSSACAAGVFVALTAVAILWLKIAGIHWWDDWMANIAAASAPGATNDFSASLSRDHMIHLQVLLWSVWHNMRGDNLLAVGSGAVIGLWAMLTVWRTRRKPNLLWGLSLMAPLTLLPVYHRTYDAGLLVLPLVWALRSLNGHGREGGGTPPLRERSHASAWAVLAGMIPFLLPVGLPTILVEKGWVSSATTASFWWQALVVPSHVWGLLVVLVAILAARLPEGESSARPCRRLREKRPDGFAQPRLIQDAQVIGAVDGNHAR